jgi:hypothetical protein
MSDIENAKSFEEFYPLYLAEHQNRVCRRLHFAGSVAVLIILGYALIKNKPLLLILIPIIGYAFAWIGHFFFEHNKPATFKRPLYSFIGDWVMFRDIVVGKLKI